MTYQWVAELLWLSARLVFKDLVPPEHSDIALDPEAAWLSDCNNPPGSVSLPSAFYFSSTDYDVDIDEWAGVLYTYAG